MLIELTTCFDCAAATPKFTLAFPKFDSCSNMDEVTLFEIKISEAEKPNKSEALSKMNSK